MGWSSRQNRIPSRQTRRRLGAALILLGVVLVLVWLGSKGVRTYQAARRAVAHLEDLQEMLRRPPEDLLASLDDLRAQVEEINQEITTLRAETRFLDPILVRLAWIPRYGPELAATPHLTALAADISAAGADLTQVLSALLPTLEHKAEDSLAQAISLLQQQRPLLQQAQARLQHATYERTLIDLTQLDDGPYARAGEVLAEFDPVLPAAVRALDTLNNLLPWSSSLLGTDAPRHYLILGQNNFELRATGGFLGSMGIVTVDRGRITDLDYRRSYDWDNPHREKVQPPFPYVRYMRFGAWFIRDANWYADFPTSAQTVKSFWQLDGHPPVDGVIAIDLIAVQSLIEALGAIEVPGHGVSIGGEDMLETIWEGYRQDPSFLTALTGAAAQQLQQLDLLDFPQLLAVLQALGRSLEEKHLLLHFDDPNLQEVVRQAGWAGAIRQDPGDFLMVVDSDFSYAEVNRFVEQEIRYRVTLDHGFRVQESILTLTYWNHFDRWTSAETRESFGGLCFDPETEDLESYSGCYGDYVRLYVPEGSRFVSADGFHDGMEYREEAGRTVIAGYVRVLPGEQRMVTVTYVPAAAPVDGQYRLTVQKQPGTSALPIEIEIHLVGSTPLEAGLQTDLRVDRTVTAMWQEGHLVLSGEGPVLAQLDPESRALQQAFAEGLAHWHKGELDQAVARWQQADTTDLILDRANLLLSQGDLDEIVALCQAALEIDPGSARAFFLLGKAYSERGDLESARESWEKSVALNPDNRAARLELGLLHEAQGDYEQASVHLAHTELREATTILWRRVWSHFSGSEDEAGLAALKLILGLDPDDANAHFVLADQLRRLKRYKQSLAAYEEAHRVASSDSRYYIGRGRLHADQGLADAAISDLETAVTVAPASAESWYYLGTFLWQFRGDSEGSIAALQRAVALHPNAWYGTVLGNIYRDSGDLTTAVQVYEYAATLPGRNSWTWRTLGQAYATQEEWTKAIEAFREGIRLQPDDASLHAALAAAYEKAGQNERAIAAYEAALALEPGNTAWQRALEKLRGE